jgi:hypothetical protein
MTSKDTQTTAPSVLLRSDGEVDEEILAYARTKIDAVVGRSGLPAVSGEVRIAHHDPHVVAAALETVHRR